MDFGQHTATIEAEAPSAKARIVFPHRINRVGYTAASGIKGDIAQTDLSTISGNASSLAQQALGEPGPHNSDHGATNTSTGFPRRANSSLSDRGNGTTAAAVVNKPRVSSAVGIFRARVAEGAKLGGGSQAPTSKLISPKASSSYSATTNWFNDQRYHPTNVILNPLLQDKQLQELKEAMYAPSKKKGAAPAATPATGQDNGSAFLTSTNIDSKPPTATAPTPPTSAKGKKKQSANTSLLNGKIGLRRLPNNDIALNDLFQAHSVSLKAPEAPFYGGALTSEVKKASPRAKATVELTTANIGTAAALSPKKKKGPTAPLISNISAIHRGLAPYVSTADSQIGLRDMVHYLTTLVPPEFEASATVDYIKPFVRKVHEDLVRLQQTYGGAAVAGGAGADAEEILNQTTASATTETASNLDVGDGTASTTGARSNRATSRAGTVRAPSVAGDASSSRAASPSTAAVARNVSPVAFSLGRTGGGGGGPNTQNAPQQKVQQQKAEDAFFATTRIPYAHVIAAFEALLKPSAPVSNVIPDEVSGALLSARVCFQLCDPLHRGYITKESVKAMRSDLATTEDYNFNVVQGLIRGMGIIEKLEEERFIMIAKKARKGKKSKKAPPMPTVRQFHMSLDEFTHLLSSDAYIALAFLPYIIKTLMNGVRDAAAGDAVTFYGKSQVANQALLRANYREKKAAEANLSTQLNLELMTADEIRAALVKREYPLVVSPLAHRSSHLLQKSGRRSEDHTGSNMASLSGHQQGPPQGTSRRQSNSTQPM